MESFNVSMSEAARLVGIQAKVMQGLLDKGEVPAWRDGRNWKIPVTTLQEWNENRAKQEARERRKQYGDAVAGCKHGEA